jgi:L-lactate dehydrogenase complex protein LldF
VSGGVSKKTAEVEAVSHGSPSDYRDAARRTLRDAPEVRASIGAATRSFESHRARAFSEIGAERWKDWARDTKAHALTHLDEYLEQACGQLEARGVHVHWAETAADALGVLDHVVAAHDVRMAVKGKSMLTEELGVNAHLEALGVQPVETDLGEYIIQLLGEPPSHIVGPAIHKSLRDCQELFHERLGTPIDASPEALASAAREALRARFLSADLGISGGNFLAADTGTVALIENEGNIRLSTSVPKLHVAFVGIEKVVPRFEDLSGFLQITARAATGQAIGLFVSLIQGPRTNQEIDGPEEVHVVLVDNGRTALLADDAAWEALRCVRCGACLNICPVYRQTGGHAYGWTYSGPIGSIISPGMLGLENALPLPFASSLCGACEDVCPVRIPIPDLLLHWRERAVDAHLTPATEKLGSRAYATLAERPGTFATAGAMLRWTPWRSAGPALPVMKSWVQERDAPVPSPRSFRQMWKEGIE